MKEEFTRIIQELVEIVSYNKLNVTDDELFDVSARIYLTEEINKKKNLLKNEQSPKEYLENVGGEEPVTKSQIWALKKAGINIKEGLTKKEAWRLLKEKKDDKI